MERLHKLIAASGFSSRRAAEELIRRGRVTVDGEVAAIGQKVDPATAAVEIDGVPLPLRPDLVYRLLYKPVGVISTARDDRGRQTVVELVPDDPRVFPVGRLDADSEGLILLTNDGALANRLTHPRYGVPKTYIALVRGIPPARVLRRLVTGVDLDDGRAAAKAASLDAELDDRALVEVVMTEGRKREVRRMFESVGHPVVRLVRTAIGPIRDASLAPGAWRPLAIDEVRALYSAGSEPWDDEPQPDERAE